MPDQPEDTAAADTTPTKRLGLAEMRTSPHVSLPRRSYSLCLAAGLIAEMRTLAEELDDLERDHQVTADADEESTGGPAPRHGGRPVPPRVTEIRERMIVLRSLMDEHTGELVIEAWEPKVWARFCDEHPPREEPAPAKRKDLALGAGVVNVDDLLEHLGEFAHTWNDDPLGPGDWEFIVSKATQGDLNQLAALVAATHEVPVDLPKLRDALRRSQAS